MLKYYLVWCEGSGDVIGYGWLKDARGRPAEYPTRERAQFAADQQHLRTRYKGFSARYIVIERRRPIEYAEANITP
jgi:hypothetical protein